MQAFISTNFNLFRQITSMPHSKALIRHRANICLFYTAQFAWRKNFPIEIEKAELSLHLSGPTTSLDEMNSKK